MMGLFFRSLPQGELKTSSSGQQFPFFAAHHPSIRKDRWINDRWMVG